MVLYVAVEERLHSPDIGEYQSFGIIAYQHGKFIMSISDVSTDKAVVTDLAKCYSNAQLAPIHLYDVVEDFLSI